MFPTDDDDLLARLEARLQRFPEAVAALKEQIDSLNARVRDAELERDRALEAAAESREDAARFREEVAQLRDRQKQAAGRLKALLTQVEQMDLMGGEN